MSDTADRFEPAIGLLEFDSIVAGIVAGDAMVKSSPVASIFAGTVHPGRYLVLVGGDTAAVEIALESGGRDSLLDSLFLADVHPSVLDAITSLNGTADVAGDALGIIETSTAATAIVAADAGLKSADVSLPTLRVCDDLGGKAYCLFAGDVADVEEAIESANLAIEGRKGLLHSALISQLHPEMRETLGSDLRFNSQLRGES